MKRNCVTNLLLGGLMNFALNAGAVEEHAGSSFRDCVDCAEMVVISGGRFTMGSPVGEVGRSDDEGPQHEVTLAAFAMGKTEVTQGQWRAVMGDNPWALENCGDECPVSSVSWDEAQDFIRKLSGKTGKPYRLPSEAEWEYACRATGRQLYCGTDDVNDVAWLDGNSDLGPHPVARKRANAFGLFDMSGSVWEWVEDCWHGSYEGAPTDGSPWVSGCDDNRRVARGGASFGAPQHLRAARRGRNGASNRFHHYGFGFRLARTLP